MSEVLPRILVAQSRYGQAVVNLSYEEGQVMISIQQEHCRGSAVLSSMDTAKRGRSKFSALGEDVIELIDSFAGNFFDLDFVFNEHSMLCTFHGWIRGDPLPCQPLQVPTLTLYELLASVGATSCNPVCTVNFDSAGHTEVHSAKYPEFWLHFLLPPGVMKLLLQRDSDLDNDSDFLCETLALEATRVENMLQTTSAGIDQDPPTKRRKVVACD